MSQNDKTPTAGTAGAKNPSFSTKNGQPHFTQKSAKNQQCNDCAFYRWALHKRRGTRSFCALTGDETSPVMKVCDFAEVPNG